MFPFHARALRAVLFSCATAVAAPALPADAPEAPPLTLEQAVAAALERNPELKSFDFELRARQARERQAALRPATEVQFTSEFFGGSGEFRAYDAAETTLALSKIIELGGKRGARVEAARADSGLTGIERQAAQLDVLAEVTRRFIAVVERQALQDLARTATGLAQNTVNASERRVNAAKSPHVELDRARIALARAQLDEREAAWRLEAGRQSLSAMWGETQPVLNGQPIGAAQADLFILPEPDTFAALMERLLANPDFLRFASEARLRDAELRLAASQRRPDLTLGGGVRRAESSGDTAAVASFSLPLFTGRRAEPLIAQAEASRGLVDAQREAALVRARAALFELHQQLRYTLLEAETLMRETQPQMAEALQETQYAFDRGRYSYLELVDARREFLDVQRSLIEAAAEAHRLRAEIERLTNAPLTAAPSAPADRNSP